MDEHTEALAQIAWREIRQLRAELAAVKAKLAALVKAVERCDNAYSHVGTCEFMHEYRGCRCGYEDLQAPLAAAKETKPCET